MLMPVGDLGEGRASRCGSSAGMVLTSDILALTVAWISAALSSSADNPLAQIWWQLLGSGGDKIPLMIVASYLPARSEEGQWKKKKNTDSIDECPAGDYLPLLVSSKKNQHEKKKWQKQVAVTVSGIFLVKYARSLSLHQNDLNVTFCQITLRKWIWSIQLHQSPWCEVNQGDWWNLCDACLVGECHVSPHALAVINLWSKSPEWWMRVDGDVEHFWSNLSAAACVSTLTWLAQCQLGT